ncbi:MAG: D-alanyl-D-alanine carboxypeptidase/D-alanyl-D-alanine-endopeptidase [Rikenellaceae bacterium]
MIRYLLLNVLLLIPFISVGNPPYVERFLQCEGLESASVGVVVKRISDGESVVEINPNQSMRLASVTKLFPTWFALEQYGAEYRYRTPICRTGRVVGGTLKGNIIIKPSADPTFNSRYFPQSDVIAEIAAILQRHKIKKIEGKIIVDKGESQMLECDIPGSWVWEDLSNYYAATPHAINFRDNSYIVEFRSGDVGSVTEIQNTYHKPKDIELINQVVSSERSVDNAWIYGGPYSNTLYIKGSIPANRDSFQIRGATPNPETVFVEELCQYLESQNIIVVGESISFGEMTKIGVVESPTLKEIISVTNKVSCNLFAESLGTLVGGSDSWGDRVEELLRERGVDRSGLKLRDASGLSPQSVASAATITDLLVYIATRDLDKEFANSLAHSGREGSLSLYGSKLPTGSTLMAKTGSMADVQCLAGYVENRKKELFAFAILVNYHTCSRKYLQEVVATLLSEEFD